MNLDEVNYLAIRYAMLIAARCPDNDELNELAIMFKLLGKVLAEKAVLLSQLNSDDLID